jgi:hypothetical protein
MFLRRGVYAAAVLTLAAGLRCQAATVSDVVAQVNSTNYGTCISSLFPTPTSTRFQDDFHDGARDLIQSSFSGLGLTTAENHFTYGGEDYYNVVGVLPGVTNPDNYLIIGAHFDSVSGSPGADDNASGVAGVMEAARVLSQYQFASSIMFVAFDREEQGLIGSKAMAQAWGSGFCSGCTLQGMISLDMIGFAYQDRHRIRIFTGVTGENSVSQGLGDALAYTDLELYPYITASAYSDHYYFAAQGYPAALLIETYYSRPMNPYYHTADDVLANIDYEFGADVTRMAVGYVATDAMLLPEPSTWVLAVCALAALAAARRRIASRRLR